MGRCKAMMRAMTQVAVPQNETRGKEGLRAATAAGHTFIAVVKRECATCVVAMPVLRQIEQQGATLEIHVQDELLRVHDDASDELTRVDEQEPESIERQREHARAADAS